MQGIAFLTMAKGKVTHQEKSEKIQGLGALLMTMSSA